MRRAGSVAPTLLSRRRVVVLLARFRPEVAFMPMRRSRPVVAVKLHGPELRALRPLQQRSPYVFVTEAATPVTLAWFLRMIQRTGVAARLPFQVHPHMLRHSTGYKLANDGQDTRSLAHYLGHRNLQSTARYTALAPDRFKGFWKD